MIIIEGNAMPIGGTSCSAPIVAGLFSLINGVRLKAGKTPVGFINPAIYKLSTLNSQAFYDVTQGSNPDGCCPGFRMYLIFNDLNVTDLVFRWLQLLMKIFSDLSIF